MGFFSKIFSGGSKTSATNSTKNTTNITNQIDIQPIADVLEQSNKLFSKIAQESNQGLKRFESTLKKSIKNQSKKDAINQGQVSDSFKIVAILSGLGIGYVATKKQRRKYVK